MTVYEFPGKTIDLGKCPPALVLYLTFPVDYLCDIFVFCSGWRDQLGFPPDSWLGSNNRLPPIYDSLPKLLDFSDFRKRENLPISVESLYRYAFQTKTTALGDLTSGDAVVALICLVIILRMIKSVLIPFFCDIGRKVGRRTHGPDWEVENEVRIMKFGEYVYRLCFHSIISIIGVCYFLGKEWWRREGFRFTNTAAIFKDFPYQEIDTGEIWYYLVQGAYNLDAMIWLLEISFKITLRPFVSDRGTWHTPIHLGWSESCRGDFSEMFVHHIATNLLIIGSSFSRLTRVGGMVFLVHDLSDVPVDLSKLANFMKWKWITIACFTLNCIVWCITRLTILPFVIFRSAVLESHYLLERGLDPLLWIFFRKIFISLMVVLILLHFTWFLMFMKMWQTFFQKSEVHDYSEHKTGENKGDVMVKTTSVKNGEDTNHSSKKTQ